MTQPNTHLGIDKELCGAPVELSAGRAVTRFTAVQRMSADDRGLVHGGFIFGLADYAAMLAVNDPNVVLGAADTRFLAPVRVGDVVVATAAVTAEKGKKRVVEASAAVGDKTVFTATFTTFVLEQHVLDS
jgi:acyl-coenzyme A thioesterase PaaI-like protein